MSHTTGFEPLKYWKLGLETADQRCLSQRHRWPEMSEPDIADQRCLSQRHKWPEMSEPETHLIRRCLNQGCLSQRHTCLEMPGPDTADQRCPSLRDCWSEMSELQGLASKVSWVSVSIGEPGAGSPVHSGTFHVVRGESDLPMYIP